MSDALPVLSMTAFALASSITPGPVNFIALGTGARLGWRASVPWITGATLGFTVLLLAVGLGLEGLIRALPGAVPAVRAAGGAFLLWMAWRLARDDGRLGSAETPGRRPSLFAGAALQWLNPKAWLAAVSGIAVYAADASAGTVWRFAAIYFVVCWTSVAAWAGAGGLVRRTLREPRRLRLFNRAMALLLAAGAAWMLRP